MRREGDENRSDSGESLIGRASELHAVRSMITAARNGLGGAVVLRGEPGIGKTALLDAATHALAGVRLIRVDGYEAESSIPYAGLQRIGAALTDRLGDLPRRHSAALRVAWGLDDGPTPDRFLVGLGMLALMAAAGAESPVVCVMDDAQWLDAESVAVMTFLARRLTAEACVVIFAVRDSPRADVDFAGIEDIRLFGLDQRAAVELLAEVLPAGFDPVSASRIAAATGGHPLALIDLANDLSLRQINDLALSRAPVPVARHLEQHYLRQVREMSAETQLWLLIAAIAAGGPLELVTRCASGLELSSDCRDIAARAGLVTADHTVDFRHPLVRSAILGATPGAERRRIHALLAEQADILGLPDLEVWHAAEAVVGVDAAVAARLDRAAQLAGRRGGLLSQSSLLARAAGLTGDVKQRNERLLTAAEVAATAGAAGLSRDLLDRVDVAHLDRVQRGRLLVTQSATAMFVADPAEVTLGTARLLEAAEEFRPSDAGRERQALLQAFENCLVAERQMDGTTLEELGERLGSAARRTDGPARVIFSALAAHVLLPYAESAPLVRTALTALMALDDQSLSEYGFVGIAFAMKLFDTSAAENNLTRLASAARDVGALRALDTALWVRSSFEVGRGNPAAAALHIEQVRELRRAIGYEAENVVNSSYLAWTDTPTESVDAIAELVSSMGFGGVGTATERALAVREIAEGQYARAFARLTAHRARPFLHTTDLVLADLVEAAVRGGHQDEAQHASSVLTAMAETSLTPWLQGLDHRCRALLAPDTAAADHFGASIERLAAAGAPADLGRSHLLFGEWLRRRKRRREARVHLRAAIDIFDPIEAHTFARRALAELAATGEQVANKEVVAGVEMSPREATVARMAADGATNADIAATLFVSANTVDYHLRKVFQKLAITSRRQLRERFSTDG